MKDKNKGTKRSFWSMLGERLSGEGKAKAKPYNSGTKKSKIKPGDWMKKSRIEKARDSFRNR